MSGRNLTGRSPQVGAPNSASDSGDAADTFIFNNNAYETHNYDQGSSNSTLPAPDGRQRLLNYSSSIEQSSSLIANPFGSNGTIPVRVASPNLTSGNQTPLNGGITSDYGRYPQGLVSHGGSLHSMGSKFSVTPPVVAHSGSHLGYSSDSSSGKSSSGFIVDTDFSPFGGYPASAFPLHIDEKEEDDYLHNPDPIADSKYERHRFFYDFKNMDRRSVLGLAGLLIFCVGMLALLVVLPVLTYSGLLNRPRYVPETHIRLSLYNYPRLSAIRTTLVDPDTPQSAYTRRARDGSLWNLVFSDEFAAEGRTFYEGDDQFFYAPDFHYQSTTDLEWYDPDAVTTANGTLLMTLDAFRNHNLFYRSGMLHSWNQMCFTQGALEVTAMLPNMGNVTGLWPGMWSMGNLGRPGYMATTDGVWPYSYDSCDAGITPNQSSPDGISYLPGQRLSSCTCSGEDHPNRGVGRGAPEIDILEGQVDTTVKCGVASQSLQLAPMDPWYMPDYNWMEIHNRSVTTMNTYAGGPYQEAVSATTVLNTNWYERGDTQHQYQKYAFEYLNDQDSGYVRWYVGDNPTWTVYSQALAPNGNVGWRQISKEPMSMVVNLGMSNSWAYIDWPSLHFPFHMHLDNIRVYQPNDSVSVTCDPPDFPTYDYIEAHPRAYRNWNNTHWSSAGYNRPRNQVMDNC